MFFKPKSPIEKVTLEIEAEMKKLMKSTTQEKLWVTHYGANDIHPRHLVYWICVDSDSEKARLEADKELMIRLRNLLKQFDYPADGRDGVHIGFESSETVNRESNGNWRHHWQ
ncbi:hypothetical protein HZ994_09225 [Akkermansiaceae bacterium]|nr:hypothetical protein HZ994_09225 [Akkermansiaceae bacterium]